ncbi:MAG: hypothetical protein WCK21_06915 [Actinomycetota bacterium]
MKRHSIARVSLAASTFLAAVLGFVPAGPVARVAAAGACTYCAGGEYHPVAPVRIFDSRHSVETPNSAGINDVAPLGAKPMSSSKPTFDVQLLGALADTPGSPLAGLASNDVLAVMLSITIVQPTGEGWLAAFPTGSSPSTLSSILNFSAGQTVPNLAIVRPGAGGKLTVQLFSPKASTGQVLIDLQGWYSSSSYVGNPGVDGDERGTRLIPVSPARIMETRTEYGGTGPLGAGGVRKLAIRGVDGVGSPVVTDVVPNRPTVEGVLLNVTAVEPTAVTHISVVPDQPVGSPTTSNLNLTPGVIKANQVAVPLGDIATDPNGDIFFFNLNGSTNLVVDVVGYFERIPDDTRQGRVVPLAAPFRAFDTREVIPFGGVTLGAGQSEVWSFLNFAASVTIGGVSVGKQSAVIGNLTNANLYRLYPSVPVRSFLTVYPADVPRPNVSNLNTTEGPPVPNMALLMYGTAPGKEQQVSVFNPYGNTHYLFDVSAVVLAD